ncbi:two-component system nitrate/nitrite response regulator NarL [Kitasatospora sp. GP30]|nr:two-component system nitrate/nitrite response regulator NarL [Kitasatospora sp. GP30]
MTDSSTGRPGSRPRERSAAPAAPPDAATGPRPLARLVIADASRLHAEALALVLAGRGYLVQATATTRGGLLRAVAACRPELCLLDLQLLDGRALDAIAQIRRSDPGIGIVALSRELDPDAVVAAAAAGVAGYLGKDKGLELLDRALRTVAAGERFIEPTLAQEALRRARTPDHAEPLHRLTHREHEVLARLAEGDDTIEIARALRMTTSTARTHVQNVLDKLGVHSRLEAVAMAHQADRAAPTGPLGQRAPTGRNGAPHRPDRSV